MASSIALQLQAIRSLIKTDLEPQKRPFTRPSILFDPKEAADIGLETILSIALSGLQALISMEERFRNYKNDLFSQKSIELDRELMGIEDNNRINESISSYLRLLSGHFNLPSAVQTIEYLIRKYKIHVYNIEELILCALPYHDTHVFVRIVQLIDTGNSKWHFLNGVKTSGAPPPRKVIVQQCIGDKGVLEALCNYASPTKKFKPSRPVISFCTAVIVEVLGFLKAVDSDVVKRILPYVISGLLPGAEGLDHKAGALMIVGLLANRAALSLNLVKSLIRSIADVARDDATDLQWFRMSLMALINLIQLQSVEMFPKKTMDILNDIRDLSGVLTGLTKEFNIDKFLAVFLDSLIEYSSSDDRSLHTLLSLLETVPVKCFIDRIVSKLLCACMRLSKKENETTTSESGSRARQILLSINKNYPLELRGAVHSFLEGSKSRNEGSIYENLCRILDGNLDMSLDISDSKIWFALEHPKAAVRRATLSGLDAAGILKEKDVDSERLVTLQDAILRRLRDDDLTVVQAALNLERLSEIIPDPCLLDVLQNVLQRCIEVLFSSSTENTSLAGDVALSCLKHALANFRDQDEYARKVARMMFPFILILPKTQIINLKALDLAKQVNWPLYKNLVSISSVEKKLKHERISSMNMDNIGGLAETFLKCPEEYMPWLVECCNDLELSKIFFFLVLLQSFMVVDIDVIGFFALYEICFPVLKAEWKTLESAGNVVSVEESNTNMLDGDCKAFLGHLFNINFKELNIKILICLFWRLLEAFITKAPEDVLLDEAKDTKWVCAFQDLFVFFASQPKHVFRKHLHYLVMKCNTSPVRFLSKLFVEEGVSVAVQVESLHCFTFLCSQPDEGIHFQLLAKFPSLLVPLSSYNQDVRVAAMSCIEGLFTLWPRVNFSSFKNESDAIWSHFLGELLGLMVQQKKLILSDRNVLTSFFTSLLSSKCHTLLVQHSIGQSFDQPKKDDILGFILHSALELSAYAKLMILSLLKGVVSNLMHVKGVESLLFELLKRRQQYHLGFDKSCHKLTKIEIEILCLLLEICTSSIASFGRHAFEDHILKALQVEGVSSEDPAIIQPCLIVLRNLSDSLYGGLKTETQELLFRDLVFLLRSANGDVQNATREALQRLNITCSMVSRMLDFVLELKGCLIGSAYGKKKMKPNTHEKSDNFSYRAPI